MSISYEISIICDCCSEMTSSGPFEGPDAIQAVKDAERSGFMTSLHNGQVIHRCRECVDARKYPTIPKGGRVKHRFKLLEGAVRRIQQLEKTVDHYDRICTRLRRGEAADGNAGLSKARVFQPTRGFRCGVVARRNSKGGRMKPTSLIVLLVLLAIGFTAFGIKFLLQDGRWILGPCDLVAASFCWIMACKLGRKE